MKVKLNVANKCFYITKLLKIIANKGTLLEIRCINIVVSSTGLKYWK